MILRMSRIIIHSVILFLKKWTYCIQPSFTQLLQSILYWIECSCMQSVSMAKGQSIKEKFKNFNFSPLHNNTRVNGKMSSSLCSTIFFNFYVHCKTCISYSFGGRRCTVHTWCMQGCALAQPGGPWQPTFAPGQLENLRFLIQIICWAP